MLPLGEVMTFYRNIFITRKINQTYNVQKYPTILHNNNYVVLAI